MSTAFSAVTSNVTFFHMTWPQAELCNEDFTSFVLSLIWSNIEFPLFLEQLKSKLNSNMLCGFELSLNMQLANLRLLC